MSENVDNFDVFIDRVESLVTRWKKFHNEHRNDAKAKDCIRGFLEEVDDKYTRNLIETADKGDDLQPDWSDRCVSCKSLDNNSSRCLNDNSKYYGHKINNPRCSNCNNWRYKF